jgi:hypothetical protein
MNDLPRFGLDSNGDTYALDRSAWVPRHTHEVLKAENAQLKLLLGPRLRFRHKSTGGIYTLLHIGVRMEHDGTTGQKQVVYENVETRVRWVRPESEFFDGRFEAIPHAES